MKVFATSVNPADYIIRQGGNELLRPLLKLPLTPGLDVAGVVEETGTAVKEFKKGDRVYGVPNFPGDGSYAEFVSARAGQFSVMPRNLTFNEAGSMPSCALIAWNGIVDLGLVKPGQLVLIHGAGGGVGSLAVQMAKAKGAYVIGTASPANFGFLKSLGADEAIDYRDQTFVSYMGKLDLVFNASPVRDFQIRMLSAGMLKEKGIFVCTQLDVPLEDGLKQALAKKEAVGTLVGGGGMTYAASLGGTTAMVEEGKLKAVIGNIYPLSAAADAHRESETKHVRGKIVLEVRKENK